MAVCSSAAVGSSCEAAGEASASFAAAGSEEGSAAGAHAPTRMSAETQAETRSMRPTTRPFSRSAEGERSRDTESPDVEDSFPSTRDLESSCYAAMRLITKRSCSRQGARESSAASGRGPRSANAIAGRGDACARLPIPIPNPMPIPNIPRNPAAPWWRLMAARSCVRGITSRCARRRSRPGLSPARPDRSRHRSQSLSSPPRSPRSSPWNHTPHFFAEAREREPVTWQLAQDLSAVRLTRREVPQ